MKELVSMWRDRYPSAKVDDILFYNGEIYKKNRREEKRREEKRREEKRREEKRRKESRTKED